MKHLITTIFITLSFTLCSCRKELDYSPITHNLKIGIESINYTSLWGNNWQDKLLFNIDTLEEFHTNGNIPTTLNIAIFNYHNNAPQYSYSTTGKIGENQIFDKSGIKKLVIYSNNTKHLNFNINKESIKCSVLTNPDIFYYSTIDKYEITDNLLDMKYNNGEWQQEFECTIKSPVISYIFQLKTTQKSYYKHNIKKLFMSGLHHTYNLSEESVSGDTTTLKGDNVLKISDSLFVSHINIFKQDIENPKLKHSLYLIYKDSFHECTVICTPLDSLLKANPNGGIIDIKLDLDKEIYNTPDSTIVGGMQATLEDRVIEDIIIYM